MKIKIQQILVLTWWLLLLSAGSAMAGDAPTVTNSAADKDWQAYRKAANMEPDKPWDDMPPREITEWVEKQALQVRALGLAFIDQYPADPRRWKIVARFSTDSPQFVKEWGPPGPDGYPTNSVIDKPAAAAWKLKVEELQTALAKASDVPVEVREELAFAEAIKPFAAANEAQDKGETVDVASLRAKLVDFAAKHPESAGTITMFAIYAGAFEKGDYEKMKEEYAFFAKSPNKEVAKAAKTKLAFCEIAKFPLDIKFTAVDGREVDLQKLRGKVVLVDFWATWCGPCVAELPNVKKAFDEYHDKGFEVVGISLEDARLKEADTPEQKAGKLAKAKKKLADFITARKIAWPQYFDGKAWDNEISTKYALNGIPAMFLLDQEGRIVTTDASGKELEKGIKRLLKL